MIRRALVGAMASLVTTVALALPSMANPTGQNPTSPPPTGGGYLSGTGGIGAGLGGPSEPSSGEGGQVLPVSNTGGGGGATGGGSGGGSSGDSPYQGGFSAGCAAIVAAGGSSDTCTGPTSGNGGGTAQPPAPPTPSEIWANTPLPLPILGINPSINGLTGLATWLWDPTGGAGVTATVEVRGYTATAQAAPTHYEWRMWQADDTPNVNPHPVVSSDRPGSEAAPAATYMYETHGEFTITATVTWSGSYTYSGPGVAPTLTDLGTTTRTSTHRYHVDSVRAARIG